MSRAREMLLAEAVAAAADETVETYTDSDSKQGAKIARSGFGSLPMYKLTPTGAVRVSVAIQSVAEVLGHPAYSAECPDCGTTKCLYETQVKGETSTNQCDGKAPKKFRICPERSCRKRIYDPQPTGKFLVDEFSNTSGDDSDDPNAIDSSGDYGSTPEQRTKTLLDFHLIGFHPATAMEMGIGKPAELPRMAVVS